ncbi:MAG: hypothetical protein LC118_04935 [Dehalococcoidia bacterium]|nr:hypothetical protein [Dehalococcoidia bacterium]
MNGSPYPPAFLPAAAGYGSLAAIRDLHAAGIDVTCVTPGRLSPLRASNAASWAPEARTGALMPRLEWLKTVAGPGGETVLIPGPDDLAWLAAEFQAGLRDHYRLYYPPGDSIYQALNKERLFAVARACGVGAPDSWFPVSPSEAARVARREGGGFVLKPKTHIGLRHWTRGVVMRSPESVEAGFRAVIRLLHYEDMMLIRDPGLALPFMQRYYPGARGAIYNLSGFIGHTGNLTGFAASRKVLQYPRRLGVGACFEAVPVDRELAVRVAEMLRGIGFHGIFEAEFIEANGELLLIDFNPRVFQSVGLPIARGLRLPYTWYLAAIGDFAGVEAQLAQSRRLEDGSGQPSRWVHRFALETMVATRLATFRMGPHEARRWLGWLRRDRVDTVDATWDASDPWPGRLDGLQHLARFVRNPRYFAGTFVRD